MKHILLLFLLVPLFISGQNREIEKIVKRIDFEQDTVKSVFNWVTDNISYDVALLKKVKIKGIDNIKIEQSQKLRIANVIKTRRGVCQHYSELFDAIMQHLGYQSVVIAGYTRSPVTKEISPIGHAWNAVKVNNRWILLDTTWGAGYVTEGNKFKKMYKSQYYDMNPSKAIFSHIPYDPLWQLLNPMVTYQAFDEEEIDKQKLSKIESYEAIANHLQLNEEKQMNEALKRSKKMGNANALVERWQNIRSQNIEVAYRNSKVKIYNAASEIMREATNKYNDYVEAKNNRFRNAKWDKKFTKTYMTNLLADAENAHQQYLSIKANDPTMSSDLTATLKNTTSFIKRVKNELTYIDNNWPKSK